MNWHDIWTLYASDLRAALRERTIVVNSILIPLLLYPVLIFLVITAITLIQARSEGFLSRVEIRGDPEVLERPEVVSLVDRFEEHERVDLVQDEEPALSAEERVKTGELDLLVEFTAETGEGDGLTDNFSVRFYSNSARDQSRTARERGETLVREVRREWLDDLATDYGIDPVRWSVFDVDNVDLASEQEIGRFVLGLLLPMMLLIMVAIGCFYPAVDATAGERERQTWETTMTLATSRFNIMAAKYLYVVTIGCIAGLLNVVAMTISMRSILGALLAGSDVAIEFSIPLVALPVILTSALLLAGFVAAGMMILAAFARTFREGQAAITPFYLVIILPVFVLNDPGLELTPKLALLPIGNLMLVLRHAFQGELPWLEIVLSAAVGMTLIVVALWLATAILRFEDVATGSYRGGLWRFTQQRLLRRHEAQSPEVLP